MNKLLAVRKFDILIANGNNQLLFNAPVDTVPSKYFYLCHAAAISCSKRFQKLCLCTASLVLSNRTRTYKAIKIS